MAAGPEIELRHIQSVYDCMTSGWEGSQQAANPSINNQTVRTWVTVAPLSVQNGPTVAISGPCRDRHDMCFAGACAFPICGPLSCCTKHASRVSARLLYYLTSSLGLRL